MAMSIKRSLIILLALFTSSAIAQSPVRSINQLLTSYAQKGQFDGSILIARGSGIVYSKPFGLANRQFNVPVSENTKFPVASITKLYTAILILKLQEEHKLNTDSPLSRYLPDLLPNSSKFITLKQLLTHVSGLPREKVIAYESPYQIKDYIKKMIKDTLLTKPGSTYAYNNVNYILLGKVIEEVTRKSWEEELREKIIIPLGLSNTGVLKRDSVINNLAYGYHNYAFGALPADPLQNDPPIYMENYATAGAIFTTIQDFFKFHLALTGNQLLKESSKELLYTPEISLGTVDRTGLYVALGNYTGSKKIKGLDLPVKIIQANGNINGFNTTYIQLPDTREVIIIFCNTDAGYLKKIAGEVLDLLAVNMK